jgi:NAD(P) transhydrogenase
MVADPSGERLLGVQVVGDSATELVHIGQLALQQGATIESFIDNVFNFPTYAEAYRVAALDILGQASKIKAIPEAA